MLPIMFDSLAEENTEYFESIRTTYCLKATGRVVKELNCPYLLSARSASSYPLGIRIVWPFCIYLAHNRS